MEKSNYKNKAIKYILNRTPKLYRNQNVVHYCALL